MNQKSKFHDCLCTCKHCEMGRVHSNYLELIRDMTCDEVIEMNETQKKKMQNNSLSIAHCFDCVFQGTQGECYDHVIESKTCKAWGYYD